MSVARKINMLVALLALLGGALVTTYTTYRDFTAARVLLVDNSINLIQRQPKLQLALHFNQTDQLWDILGGHLGKIPVRYAVLYDASGKRLVERRENSAVYYQLPNFASLRGNAQSMHMQLTSRKASSPPATIDALIYIQGIFGERISDVSLPIFSAINPGDKTVDELAYTMSLLEDRQSGSQHVAGYLHLGISHPYLSAQLAPKVIVVAIVCLMFCVLCMTLSWYYTRRITAPLSHLAEMAEKIAEGELDAALKVEGSGEVRQITGLLNTIIGGLNSYKNRMTVDHQLLSMKVEERTEQLSKRNQELKKAVQEVTRTKDELRKLAYYDSLTALPNRRLFTEQLNLLLRLAVRHKTQLALIFLDIDNFKRINDSLGHSAGDLLLREVGHRLTASVRESDVVAHFVEVDGSVEVSRLGGDEFTVVLNQIESTDAAMMVAKRLLEALSAPMIIDNHELVVTPSIGIAIGPDDSENVEGLLKAADTAMYHAKKAGKNTFKLYNQDMVSSNVERLQLETDLRKAIERNELVLYYQPQVDIETGSVVGIESLIRWQHPEHGLIPPIKFIPLAEEMGLIVSIGEWALREACTQIKEIRGEGLKLPKVSVNVSALEFNNTLVQRVKQALLRTGIRPEHLELELTEGIMMDSRLATVEALEQLKELGVSLSIDDFGTGYSSLSYLSRFPLDELKIDRSFVIDYDKGEENASLIVAIIAMAKSLNLRIVAEGVETHQQMHFLRDQGVSIIQGYLFSKPVPANELTQKLTPGHFKQQIAYILEHPKEDTSFELV